MKPKTFFSFALVAAFFNIASVSAAQITIGGKNPPKAGVILDLNSTIKGGLQLSNVALTDLTQIPASFPKINGTATDEQKQNFTGALIWNTNDMLYPNGAGVYLWNGEKWSYLGGSDGEVPYVQIPPPVCTNPISPVRFARYNLGADSTLNTPKKQMKYFAENAFNKLDGRVYGGLFQWGRKDIKYGINTGTFTRYDNQTNTSNTQTTSPAEETFYIGFEDWRSSREDKLWGNGKGIAADGTENKGGVLHTDGKYYQNTDWAMPENNPCPAGWRIPTQDEWERLGNYDCNPSSLGGTILSSGSTTLKGSAGLTWIQVACKNNRCTPTLLSATDVVSTGYAIYRTSDWENAQKAGNVYSGWDGSTANFTAFPSLHAPEAPEPLLFLPAAGYRHHKSGKITNTGAHGDYWSSSVNGKYSHSLYFDGSKTAPNDHSVRANGFNIRCVTAD
ncbi:MAG: fibrobacter succinogenes major paralogous domain-containing protein [Prevotellaceae bacterium]|jgi:uncharacterized protein (TIGR02145 family)|nr:fibrobacter succinogenes major paralogous domain-containing protein [Prevotellaceae bacterium]